LTLYRNVSFQYPGSQASRKALIDINLTIEPGQFVVIVGANGSGKSTLLKLLTRLYQPDTNDKNEKTETEEGSKATTSEILIDSLPASSYSERSLRRAMAILNQDNLIYRGFSLGENIALGYTPMASHQDAVMEAAKKAGAKEVLERMKEGTETILDPILDYHHFNVREQDKDHPMKKLLEEIRRKVEVSGGERQRIVA
jgi:ABC-type bacteriocin/lantibiotic exporter with double-glycine peptidase domain